MSQALFGRHRVLWMGPNVEGGSHDGRAFCCEDMTRALSFACDQHESPFECADQLLCFNPMFEEYGLIVHDGGASYVCIAHCPWCGTKLPDSRRDQFFDLLDALGLDASQDDLPERFTRPGWWLETDNPNPAPDNGSQSHE